MEASRARRYATPLSLLILDIDHFKAVNDNFGHQAGDAVLVELARFISAHVRAHDVFARWGGEEFALLAIQSDRDEAMRLAEKLRQAVAEHDFPSVERLSISIGMATYRPEEGIQALVARADEALYGAKNAGRNRVEGE